MNHVCTMLEDVSTLSRTFLALDYYLSLSSYGIGLEFTTDLEADF